MALDDPRFLALAAIVAGAFAVEATTGFGATVIALTLAVHLYPLDALIPVLVPFGLALSAAMVWRQHAHADLALLARRILPLMGLGLALGFAAFARLSSDGLRRAFGVFVVVLAAAELWRMRRPAPAGERPLPAPAMHAALLGAGVIHGVFASGGPLLVYALGRSGLEKRTFRATLACVWLVMGTALTAAYAASGRLGRESLIASAALLPALAVALPIGEWAHQRLDETRFRRLVFALLLAAGATSLL